MADSEISIALCLFMTYLLILKGLSMDQPGVERLFYVLIQFRLSLNVFGSFHLIIQLLFYLSNPVRFLMLFALRQNDPSML